MVYIGLSPGLRRGRPAPTADVSDPGTLRGRLVRRPTEMSTIQLRRSPVHGPGNHSPGLRRASAGQLRGMRLLRVCVLASGLAVGLVIALEASPPRLDARFVGGAALILVSSLATFAPNFARWGR